MDVVCELMHVVSRAAPMIEKFQFIANVDDPTLALARTLGARREGFFRKSGRVGATPVDQEALAIYVQGELPADGPRN